jgi:15-cis-phytoene synthase
MAMPRMEQGCVAEGGVRAERRDWELCRNVTRIHARTFFFASHLLPTKRRRAIQAVYAYCRIADDLVDRAMKAGGTHVAEALNAWEAELCDPRHPVAIAFAEARACYDIPLEPVHDLLAGIRMDLQTVRYQTWGQLRDYCYHVAGTIGLLTAPILGCRDDAALPYAVDLGIAMQLTNIIRDVGEDARLGRIYLPQEDLDRFSVSADALLSGSPSGAFADLIAFEISRAREFYQRGRVGIPALSIPGQFAVIASANLYSSILSRVEAQEYDVLTRRAVVPTHQKFAAMPSVARSFILAQF